MRRQIALVCAVVFGMTIHARSQGTSEPRNRTSYSVKVGSYYMFQGGWGLNLGLGFWRDSYVGINGDEKFRVQPGANTSLNFSFDERNLGNRSRLNTGWQLNAVFSPMVTFGSRRRGYAEELHPFYFGNANAVYANFRSSITLGSNFVLAPRSVGRNVFSSRNRTQQLIYIGVRGGIGRTANMQLHIYDDFLGTDAIFLNAFADNYDRFFSGGGNMQLRVSQFVKLKAYSEVYTGSFQRDMFDFPDLYLPREKQLERKISKGKFKFWTQFWPRTRRETESSSWEFARHPRYVAQEPGQKLFNVGRTFAVVEYEFQSTAGPGFRSPVGLIVGSQGGHYNMWSQNIIHNHFRGNKIRPQDKQGNEDKLFTAQGKGKGGAKSSFERLHHFYPASKNGRWIFGVSGAITNKSGKY